MGFTLRCSQDIFGDRKGAKEKGRAVGSCLEDLGVPGSKEGKQKWGSKD